MADNMSPCPVCEKADVVRQDRIVDLSTSARFPPLLWARFRALGKTVLYRCPACRFARFEPVAAVDADFYKNISSRQGKRLT